MKKLLAILLLMIYTATSSGTVMNAHFCMGELAGISFGEKQSDACGYCGMDDAGCCHNLLQVVKLDNSQLQKTTSFSFDIKLFNAPIITSPVIQNRGVGQHERQHFNSPAYLGDPPVYLRNCVFRI